MALDSIVLLLIGLDQQRAVLVSERNQLIYRLMVDTFPHVPATRLAPRTGLSTASLYKIRDRLCPVERPTASNPPRLASRAAQDRPPEV